MEQENCKIQNFSDLIIKSEFFTKDQHRDSCFLIQFNQSMLTGNASGYLG